MFLIYMMIVTTTNPPKRKFSVLIDLNGTIHIEDHLINGTLNAIKRLRAADINILFLSNTSKESSKTLHKRLERCGLEINPNEIFTALSAAKKFIDTSNLHPFMLLSDDAKQEFTTNNGVDNDYDAVLIGLSPSSFNYETMQAAFKLIMNGCPLIAINKARYYRTLSDLNIGPGAFVEALEYAASCKSIVLGKPQASFFQTALDTLGSDAESTFMIGDDVKDDIDGAQRLGIKGILVQTGKYLPRDEMKIEKSPMAVCKDIGSAVDFIMKSLETEEKL